MVDIIPSSQLVIGHGAFSIVYRAKLKSVSLNTSGQKSLFYCFIIGASAEVVIREKCSDSGTC